MQRHLHDAAATDGVGHNAQRGALGAGSGVELIGASCGTPEQLWLVPVGVVTVLLAMGCT